MLSKKHIKTTDQSSLLLIDHFIQNNPIGIQTFRYYSKRPYSIIDNHIYTCLYYDINNACVGYGHLDYEDTKIWLGIMVSDIEVGKKFGNQILDDLIQNANDDIYLSVDISNNIALKLYQKKKFQQINKTTTHYIMKLNLWQIH